MRSIWLRRRPAQPADRPLGKTNPSRNPFTKINRHWIAQRLLAVVTVSIIFSLAVIFAIALGIRQLMPEGGIKSVVHDAWARLEASWERTHRLPRSPSGTGEEPRNSFSKEMEKRNLLKKFGAGDKPDKLPNPFAPPEPQNPFDPKPGNPFDPKIRFSVDPK
jgi:hypothetical protein